MPVINKYETVEKTTGWISPNQLRAGTTYGRNDWLNIQNLKYWDDVSYAICEDGVTDEISSQNIYFYDFGFNVPSDAEITNVSVRIRCLNDTIGGGEIVDELLRIKSTNNEDDGQNTENNTVNNRYWDDINISENIYKKYDWLEYQLNPAIVNDPNFGFVYRCRGTSEHACIPLVYGVQVKVDYSVYEETEYYREAKYEITASLPDYVFEEIGDTKTLTVTSKVVNGVSGVVGNIYVSLSDELIFSDGGKEKVIQSENTDENYNKTHTLTVEAVKAGIGSITVKSGSLDAPLRFTVLVDTENEFLDKLINLNNNSFISNHATVRGGGYFNANNIINVGSTFEDNSADVFGDDYYDARTAIKFTPAQEYEVDRTVQLNVAVELNDPNLNEDINTGLLTLYENTTEVGAVDVISGEATINYTPSNVGETTLHFVYSGSSGLYSKSELDKEITVTKKKTSFLTNTEYITQHDYFSCVLVDSDNNPLAGKSVTLTVNGVPYPRITTEDGEVWLRINLLYGDYNLTMSFDGDSTFDSSSMVQQIHVIKTPTVLITEDTVENKDNTLIYKAVLTDNENNVLPNQQITFNLKNSSGSVQTYSKMTDTSGTTYISPVLDSDVYTVTTSYGGSDLYESVSADNYLIISSEGIQDIKIELTNSDITGTVNNDVTVAGKLNPYYGEQTVRILVFDEEEVIVKDKTETTDSGVFSSTLNFTDEGAYTFYVLFAGDEYLFGNYSISKGTISVGVAGGTGTVIEATDYKASITSVDKYYIRLVDEDSTPLASKTVHYKIGVNNSYKEYTGTTDSEGYSYYPIDLTAGVYPVTVSFLGDEDYSPSNRTRTITILNNGAMDTVLSRVKANGFPPYYADDTSPFYWSLKANGESLGKKVNYLTMYNLTEDTLELAKTTTYDEGGTGVYNFKYPAGYYLFIVDFVGDAQYNPSSIEELVVTEGKGTNRTILTGENSTIYKGQVAYYKATLTDIQQNRLSDKPVLSVITDSEWNSIYLVNFTNDEGEISIPIDFEAGYYTIQNIWSGDEKYDYSSNMNGILINQAVLKETPILTAESVMFSQGETQKYSVTLTDTEANLLTGETVQFKVNDTFYEDITDSTGKAEITLTLPPGEYPITASFVGNDTYSMVEVTRKISVVKKEYAKTIISALDTQITYGSGGLVAKLTDEENTPLANQPVKLTLTGTNGEIKSFTQNTSTTGEVIFNLSTIFVGEYNCLIEYGGDSTYESSSMTVNLKINHGTLTSLNLTAVDVTMDYAEEEALAITASQSVNGEKATIRFNRTDGTSFEFLETFTDNTISFVLDELPAGKYNVNINYPVQTTYENTTASATVLINKRQLSAETSKTETDDKTVLTVILKDNENNLVPNQYVLFKINSENYNSATNLDGEAEITINRKLTSTDTVEYVVLSNENYIGTEGVFTDV